MSVTTQIFDKPSGNVRGLIQATAKIKGKDEVIATVTLLTNNNPDISIRNDVKQAKTVEDLVEIASVLLELAKEIRLTNAIQDGKVAQEKTSSTVPIVRNKFEDEGRN
jgi:hypothetical protein